MKVTITGPAGAGKTLLTQAIFALLRRHGFTVSVADEGGASMPGRHAHPDDYVRFIPKGATIHLHNRIEG